MPQLLDFYHQLHASRMRIMSDDSLVRFIPSYITYGVLGIEPTTPFSLDPVAQKEYDTT